MTVTRLIVSTIHNDPDNLCYKVNYEAKDGEVVAGTLLLVYKLISTNVTGGSILVALDATRKVPVGVYLTKRTMIGKLREKYSCPVREL